jgi:hypothetical protein
MVVDVVGVGVDVGVVVLVVLVWHQYRSLSCI